MSAIAPICKATASTHGKSARTAPSPSGAAGFFAMLEQALAQGDPAAATATPSATQPAQDPSGAATQTQPGETKTDDAGTLDAAALAAAQALAATAAPATSKNPDAGAALAARLTRHHATPAQAPAAATAKPQSAAATQPATRIWNTRDLTQQLKAALGGKLTADAQEQAGTPGKAQPNVAASFAAHQEGDKIRLNGTQNLMRAMQAGKTQAQTAKQTLTPQAVASAAPAHNAALKSALQQFTAATTAPQPGKSMDDALIAELSAPAKAAAGHDESPLVAPAAVQPLEWTPEPVATTSATGTTETASTTRMPTLAEQVRQATDFIADRTTGVIRMGDKGVEANLRLYPPDLGGVRVQMSVTASGATQTNFIVERPETAQLLQQHLRSFQQGMESRGLAVERVQVTLASTVGAASATSAESGWRQETAQDFRRESSLSGQRDNQTPKRERGNKERPAFEG